jgi:hypothetical protein
MSLDHLLLDPRLIHTVTAKVAVTVAAFAAAVIPV